MDIQPHKYHCHYTNSKYSLIYLTIFIYPLLIISGLFLGGCAPSLSDKKGGDDFRQWHKEYQGCAKAGQIAINKKKYREAIDHYTRAIKLSPFEVSHYYYRGLAWYKKGNKERAIEDFDKVIILDSGWRSAYIYRALCRMKGGEYREALSDYKIALNLKHDDAGIHNNLAWLYATANDEKFRDKVKALEHALKAAKLSKEKNAQVLDTLARAYYINEKLKEAVEAEKKALELEPENQGFKERLEEYEKGVMSNGKISGD